MEVVFWMLTGWLAICAIKAIDRALRNAQRRRKLLQEYIDKDPRFKPRWMIEAERSEPNA